MDHIGGYLLHAGVDQFPEIEVGVVLFDVLVQFLIVDFVALFVFAVVG